MKVLVTGDRNWTDGNFISTVLTGYYIDSDGSGFTIIEGGARGADSKAKEWVTSHQSAAAVIYPMINLIEYNAKWMTQGKAAGPIRNRLMLDQNPDTDFVLAFHSDIQNSKGTKDMIEYALKKSSATIILYTGTEDLTKPWETGKHITKKEDLVGS